MVIQGTHSADVVPCRSTSHTYIPTHTHAHTDTYPPHTRTHTLTQYIDQLKVSGAPKRKVYAIEMERQL